MRSRHSEPDWLAVLPAHGWVALFNTDGRGGRKHAAQPVVAWADTGEALVVDRRKGCLAPAAANTAFVRLEPAQRQNQTGKDVQGGVDDPEVKE